MRADLQSLDIHHLTVLSLLLQHCSVTKVAEKTGQAQPAISRMLVRLRKVTGDPLLVRSGIRMVLTERAVAMREPLQEILAQVARIEVGTNFAPDLSDKEFRIACADCIPTLLLPQIIARLTSAGRRIRAKLRLIDPAFDVARALEEGELDLVINNSPNPREDLRIGRLYTDEVVCMMRSGHPLAGEARLSLARYLNMQHLAPQPSSLREMGPVDGELAKVGYRRVISATVPEFNLAPYVLLSTDLVFTTGRVFAEHYAKLLPVTIVPAPREFPPMRFYQLWHERNHASDSNRWLRQQVSDAVRELVVDPHHGDRGMLTPVVAAEA
ncbi:LysR family transcriptional regulator [Pigmentiphaga litoralis]|uniref:DNA-binding transcriptional LysR family regulator n=1 Tax=Pigmentiphaga litoralis TaxID=516702 RepID=A0A7Y9LQC5_9BURK|nr:LysR family transcriptional regulator [Pigmentiphaga litoralis]NYE26702.1 DNA-binding transcriptional LysR family regulator [Pigmentiphaga litoralis]NYE85888.1 DNA-binding transcriptional LysR family regulator [Pigmentiphaga litoralis]